MKLKMKPSQIVVAGGIFAAATLVAPFAFAHAKLLASDPQAGVVLEKAPKEISLTFNEKIEEPFSSISLLDKDGKAVSTGKAKVDSANSAVLRLPVQILPNGSYSVKWVAVGHDGHRRTGDFTFSVK